MNFILNIIVILYMIYFILNTVIKWAAYLSNRNNIFIKICRKIFFKDVVFSIRDKVYKEVDFNTYSYFLQTIYDIDYLKNLYIQLGYNELVLYVDKQIYEAKILSIKYKYNSKLPLSPSEIEFINKQ